MAKEEVRKKFTSIEEVMEFWKKYAPAAHKKEFRGQHLSLKEIKKLVSSQAGPKLHAHLTKCQWCCNKLAKIINKEEAQ